MKDKRWYLISYDVRHPKRLKKTAKTLEGFGHRVQYSIFRCRLSKREFERLHWELTKILEPEDDLLIIGLCPNCVNRIRTKGSDNTWVIFEKSFCIH